MKICYGQTDRHMGRTVQRRPIWDPRCLYCISPSSSQPALINYKFNTTKLSVVFLCKLKHESNEKTKKAFVNVQFKIKINHVQYFNFQVLLRKCSIGIQRLHQLFNNLPKKTTLKFTTCTGMKTVCSVQSQISLWSTDALDTQRCHYERQ